MTKHIIGEACPITGLLRIRMERVVEQAGVLNGDVASKDRRFYLDGTEARVLTAGAQRQEDLMAWEAVPARTQDVLDFGRLETAAKALTRQMGQHGPDNPPSAEQIVTWLQGWQNLQGWRKEAEARFTQADGQIDTVAILLRQFL
jgi:hypothetical protein